MLHNQRLTVNRYDFTIAKGILQLHEGMFVSLLILIYRHQDGIINNKEIGIAGRQALTFAIMDGGWYWQWNQLVRVARCCCQVTQFPLQGRRDRRWMVPGTAVVAW